MIDGKVVYMVYVIALVILLGIDLIIKYGIEQLSDNDFPRDMPHTDGHIQIKKFHNPGMPFGFLKQYPQLIRNTTLITTSIIMGRFSMLLVQKKHHMEKLSYAIIIAGALSNLYDRFFRGYVVDYFSFAKSRIAKLRLVIYNLGDICIFVGGAMLTIVGLINTIKKK